MEDQQTGATFNAPPIYRHNPAAVIQHTLSEKRSLAGLVLGDLVGSVLLARLALAVGVSGLGDVNLGEGRAADGRH